MQLVVYSRVGHRSLRRLAYKWAREGVPVRSTSHLVKLSLEWAAQELPDPPPDLDLLGGLSLKEAKREEPLDDVMERALDALKEEW